MLAAMRLILLTLVALLLSVPAYAVNGFRIGNCDDVERSVAARSFTNEVELKTIPAGGRIWLHGTGWYLSPVLEDGSYGQNWMHARGDRHFCIWDGKIRPQRRTGLVRY